MTIQPTSRPKVLALSCNIAQAISFSHYSCDIFVSTADCSGTSPVRYAKFESIRYFIDIDILQNFLEYLFGIPFLELPYRYRYRYRYFSELPYRYRYRYRYFQLLHIDIDIDIDIFQKCRYIDNRYFISIF